MSRGGMDGGGNHPQPSDDLYNDAHRAFLQAFLSHSVFIIDDLKRIIADILTVQEPERERFADDITQPIITSMVQTTNAKIAPLDFEIRSTRDQTNRTLTYALVNTASDTFTQLATTMTPDEIAYVKRLLDAMFEENNTKGKEVMAVKDMRAIQLARAPQVPRPSQVGESATEAMRVEANVKSISNVDAERILQDLVLQGFLQKSRANYYSLAPRALMELRAYLKETYNEAPMQDEDDDSEPLVRIRDCEGCREIVTVGLRCSNRDCSVRWHDGCANQYFMGQKQNMRRCPKCKTEWDGNMYVGERADRLQSRHSKGGRPSNARIRENYEDDVE